MHYGKERISIFIQKLDDEMLATMHLHNREEADKFVRILKEAFWFDPVKIRVCDREGNLLATYLSKKS